MPKSKIFYPRIDHDDKKSVKIKTDDIDKIKHLYQVEKWNLREIAELYNVAQTTIRYNIDDEYRMNQNLKSARNLRDRRMSDDIFRISHQKQITETIKRRYASDEKYRFYRAECNKQPEAREKRKISRRTPEAREKRRIRRSTPEARRKAHKYYLENVR